MVCAKCITATEYDFDPADGELLALNCAYDKAGSGLCAGCTEQNKVC